MSAISSRKSVPMCAVSNFPRCTRTAPVNAPGSWPKSSLSGSVSLIADVKGNKRSLRSRRRIMNSMRQQRLGRSGAAKKEKRGVAPGSKERRLQAPSHDRVKRSEFFQPQIGNGAHHEITAEDSRGAAELAQRRV